MAGAIDLLVCAAAVRRGHTVLRVENGLVAASAVVKEELCGMGA
ncbi:hypothetical protein [Streptomyces flaveolus]|uniref:Uncharacterized protein n=1 Tax=Streptomyces flaveolus TaxID=67297 RepID=A0ABV3A9F7_9ACTN